MLDKTCESFAIYNVFLLFFYRNMHEDGACLPSHSLLHIPEDLATSKKTNISTLMDIY